MKYRTLWHSRNPYRRSSLFFQHAAWQNSPTNSETYSRRSIQWPMWAPSDRASSQECFKVLVGFLIPLPDLVRGSRDKNCDIFQLDFWRLLKPAVSRHRSSISRFAENVSSSEMWPVVPTNVARRLDTWATASCTFRVEYLKRIWCVTPSRTFWPDDSKRLLAGVEVVEKSHCEACPFIHFSSLWYDHTVQQS